jgi:hypothetical protein
MIALSPSPHNEKLNNVKFFIEVFWISYTKCVYILRSEMPSDLHRILMDPKDYGPAPFGVTSREPRCRSSVAQRFSITTW